MSVPAIHAAQAAVDYLRQIQHLAGESIEDIRLEELELSEDEQYWLVTLGYSVPVKTPTLENPLFPTFKKHYERVYKIFKVDAQQGTVQSMKIRQV